MRTAALVVLAGAFLYGKAGAQTELNASSRSVGTQERLARLEALAISWGRLFLLHPSTASGSVDWLQVLVRAIPEVERAGTAEAFAATLNRAIFSPLNDPAALASVSPGAFGEPALRASLPIVTRLRDGVALLSLTDPHAPRPRDFPRQLRDALATAGNVDLMIVDLRWASRPYGQFATRSEWLTLLLDSVRTSGRGVSRERQGWSSGAPSLDSWYSQRWRFDQSSVFRPLSHPQATLRSLYPSEALEGLRWPARRTTIVVNNASIRTYEPLLNALLAQPEIAVIYERTGPLDEGGDTTIFGGVQLRFHLRRLLSADGSVGMKPDLVVGEHLDQGELADAGVRAFESKGNASRPPFDDTIAAAPSWPRRSTLNREERIAGLLAMWAVMTELNPHITFASVDWRRQLPVWIPRVEAADSLTSYYRVLNEIVATLRDGHARAAHPEMGFSGPYSIPAIVMRVEDRPVVVEVAPFTTGTGLRVGDEIVAIDGRPVRDVEASTRTRISARDPEDFMWGFSGPLRGQKRDSPITLTVRDGVSERTVSLRQSVTAAESYDTTTVRRLAGGIGYVNLRAVPAERLISEVDSLERTSGGLVFDLRGYPILGAIDELIGRYIDRPVTIRGIGGGLPRMAVDQHRVTRTMVAIPVVATPSAARRLSKPTILLVDGRAGSAAESIAMQLATAANVIVVGAPTVGATGSPTTLSMPGGGAVRFTGELMLNPDGTQHFAIGVVPQVIARPTVRGLRAGRDEVLEAGIAALRRRMGSALR